MSTSGAVKGLNNGSGDDAEMLERARRAFGARDASQSALWWISAEPECRMVGRPTRRAAEYALGRLLPTYAQVLHSRPQSFQRDRIERDVALQQLRTGLVQQYEDARIREVHDTIDVMVNRHQPPCCAPISVDAL